MVEILTIVGRGLLLFGPTLINVSLVPSRWPSYNRVTQPGNVDVRVGKP